MYRQLDADRLVLAIERLHRRIVERFPDAGLCQVGAELLLVAREAKRRADWIARPNIPLRIATAVVILIVLASIVGAAMQSHPPDARVGLFQLVQILEAAINDLVLIGAAIFFLLTIEGRVKRHRALAAIHELRAMAHVIDIRQLTKDPERVIGALPPTASSPRVDMSPALLARYLDYCSEMLSLVGKVAVLYVQRFDDPIALDAVNEVERLCSGLSSKIWQKIMILHTTT